MDDRAAARVADYGSALCVAAAGGNDASTLAGCGNATGTVGGSIQVSMTVADAYLYVMLRWAAGKGITLPGPLAAYKARLEDRPALDGGGDTAAADFNGSAALHADEPVGVPVLDDVGVPSHAAGLGHDERPISSEGEAERLIARRC